ncbi:22853_t:CDS:1, partial [Racocetra persica]
DMQGHNFFCVVSSLFGIVVVISSPVGITSWCRHVTLPACYYLVPVIPNCAWSIGIVDCGVNIYRYRCLC